MNSVRRVAKNTILLILSRLATSAFSMALVIYAARILGDAGFGNYSFILVFVSYFYAVASFGLRDLIVKDVSADRSRADRYVCTSATLVACTSALALVLMLVVSQFVHGVGRIRLPLVLASLSVIPTALYTPFDGAFRAFEKMEYTALVETLWSVVRVAAGMLALFLGYRLTALVLVFCGGEALKCLHAYVLYRRRISASRGAFDLHLLPHLLRKSFPLMVWGLVGIIYYKVDIFMLMQMRGAEEVGWYSASYRIIDLLTMCALFAMQSVLPLLSSHYGASREAFAALYRRLFTRLLVVYLGAAFLLTLSARPLIALVYGPAYAPSAPVLQILGWASVLVVVSYLFGNVLIASDLYVLGVKVAFLTTLVNIACNLALIPRFGAAGAALATLVGEIATFLIILAFITRRIAAPPAVNTWLRLAAVAAGSAAALRFSSILPLSPAPAAILFSCVYAALVCLARLVRGEDLAYFRRIFAG